MVAISSAFDKFDFVIDSFQFSGMNGVFTVAGDPVPVTFKGAGKLGDRWVSHRAGQGIPLINSLVGSDSRSVGPDVFEFLHENHDCVDGFVKFQELFQMLSVF